MKDSRTDHGAPAKAVSGDDRVQAARLLDLCTRPPYRSIDRLLAEAEAPPGVRSTVYGCLRHYYALEAEIDRRLRRPLPGKSRVIRYLIMVGAYQIVFGKAPLHAAVHATVAGCDRLGMHWLKGLVNAILRDIERNRQSIATQTEHSVELPEWLFDALQAAWGDAVMGITRALQEQPVMTLRINTNRSTVAGYRQRLADAGHTWRETWVAESLTLNVPIAQNDLPDYVHGAVAVQDAGAQFAAGLLAPRPGDRVLDACAAPGGKLFHLLERYPGAAYVAVERSPDRAQRLKDEAARLRHAGDFELVIADACEDAWWDGEPFQYILIDAPCTGTGTMRRRPDVRLHRSPADVTSNARLQARLLEQLWPRLATGGRLLYCTCSLLPAENQDVIRQFLDGHAEATLVPVELPIGRQTVAGWQILPDTPMSDGFFYALLAKS